MNDRTLGWINGLIGVIIFSGSLPATRVAVIHLDPWFVTAARAFIAGLLAAGLLLSRRAPRPEGRDMGALTIVAACVVVGFPLFSALALQTITAARSLVFLGLLPLATALFGVMRAGERPRLAFWVYAALGSACIVAFALTQDARASLAGDLYMLAAILSAGYGYAEGARLTRHLGGSNVISWALLISLPFSASAAFYLMPANDASVAAEAWIAVGYVALFSMFIGFFFWYRGLAQGGIAAIGQLQLLQPFMGLGLAAAILQEPVSWEMLAATTGVIVCVALARRAA